MFRGVRPSSHELDACIQRVDDPRAMNYLPWKIIRAFKGARHAFSR